ncbi:unnamed protein product [Wickerhamomyces anomalus]
MPLKHTPATEGFLVKQAPIPSPGNNTFVGDFFTSDAPEGQQMTCGFYQQSVGDPLEYEYEYVIKADHFYVSDETGQKIDAKEGDIFYFKKGVTIKFEVVGPEGSYAKNFFTAQRKPDSA